MVRLGRILGCSAAPSAVLDGPSRWGLCDGPWFAPRCLALRLISGAFRAVLDAFCASAQAGTLAYAFSEIAFRRLADGMDLWWFVADAISGFASC